MDWLPNKGLAQQTTSQTNAQLLGRPKNLTTGQKGKLASNRKAWPRRNGARFRLWPASPTGRPGQGGTSLAFDSGPALRPEGLAKDGRTFASDSAPPLRPEGLANAASDFDPRLRPGMRRTSAYSSPPTSAVGAD